MKLMKSSTKTIPLLPCTCTGIVIYVECQGVDDVLEPLCQQGVRKGVSEGVVEH